MTKSLITEGAAPIYFDSAGMTALYFINSNDILEILLDTFKDFFEWQDWWARLHANLLILSSLKLILSNLFYQASVETYGKRRFILFSGRRSDTL